MGTAGQSRRLWKEPSICERHREISVGLALDHDAAIDAVVTDIEALHPYIEVGALSGEIEQRGVTFGVVDAEHAPSRRRICGVRGLFFHLTAVSALVCSDHPFTILEGKAKSPRSGETTNDSDDAASALAHLGPTYHPPRTINKGPFQGRLELSFGLIVG